MESLLQLGTDVNALHPEAFGSALGAAANQGHIEVMRVLLANEAVAGGARVLCGGKRWTDGGEGTFLEPTVLVDVPEDAACMREETFAPAVPVAAFELTLNDLV